MLDHRGKVLSLPELPTAEVEDSSSLRHPGMKLALADIQDSELDRIAGEMKKSLDVLAMTTDVAEVNDMERLPTALINVLAK